MPNLLAAVLLGLHAAEAPIGICICHTKQGPTTTCPAYPLAVTYHTKRAQIITNQLRTAVGRK